MPRLFVAIRPPREVREALLNVMGGVPGARWQSDDQLHLTLRFIGEVDDRAAEDVALALSRLRHPPFAVELGQYGSFEQRGRVNALWIGVADAEPLRVLHLKTDHALVGVGLPAEGRAYKPHITLARFGRHGGNAAPLLALPPPSIARFAAKEFHLMESHLASKAAHYEIVATFPLARP